MNNNFNLEIGGFGLINEAKIEINKINVVGGVNSSGKSTASKLLYCFLRANSSNVKKYVLSAILPNINEFINITEKPDKYGHHDLPDKFTIDDDLMDIIGNYYMAKNNYEKLRGYFEITEFIDEIEVNIDKFIPFLLDQKGDAYSSIIKTLFENESLLNFEGESIFSNGSFKSMVKYEQFKSKFDLGIFERVSELNKKNIDFDDCDYKFIYLTEGSFDFLNEVIYMDSVSYFDLYHFINNKNINKVFEYKEHLVHLLNLLGKKKNEDALSEEDIEKIDNVKHSITDIIGGKVYKKSRPYEDFYYKPKNSKDKYNVNISSGIQQISIIQILLNNHSLKSGSFLIIDEPEVNLHPEWQFKFAEILVLLAKELDIHLYINSHSPMFIEAMEVLTQYYDMEKDTNFYLTEKQVNNTYNFVKIEYDNLYELYDNLAKPFDSIEVYRLKNEYKKGNY